MPVLFTPMEQVIVKAINQEEFKDFSYQNLDWHCLERGELPKDDANDGRRALRDDLSVNLKQTLPMSPVASHTSNHHEMASSEKVLVTTDHVPVSHVDGKKSPIPTQSLMNSAAPSSFSLIAQQKPINNNHTQHRSLSATRVITDHTDM